MDVWENFDKVNLILPESGKHSLASIEADLALVLKELHEMLKVFVEIPGRNHRSLPTTRRNRFLSINWDKFTKRFRWTQETVH